jgi:hypothetical protein
VDRTRASDSERERDAAAQGRLTIDELDERTAAAYAAVTRGELAELLDDLPVPREPAPPTEHKRPRGLPWLPGRYPFSVRWRAPAGRNEAMADLTEYVAPPMNRFGFGLVERTSHRLVFERGGETLLLAHGVAPLPVRRAFAGLRH